MPAAGVSCSGLYIWLVRPASARAVADAVLNGQLKGVFTGDREVCGAPRPHRARRRRGAGGAQAGGRLMRAAGLQGVHRRRRRYGLAPQVPGADLAPDRVDRKLAAAGPNQQGVLPACGGGVADVTCVPATQLNSRAGRAWRASPTCSAACSSARRWPRGARATWWSTPSRWRCTAHVGGCPG